MSSEALREIMDRALEPCGQSLRAARASGRPVVGYFCHYVPVEVLLAVSAVPFRLRAAGSEDSSAADALMSERVCTYVRHVVSRVLEGDLDGLAAVVASNTCDHVRRSADVLRHKSRLGLVGFVSVPRSPREDLYGYYLDEIRSLYTELASHFGLVPTDDALRTAIATSNAVRDRLRALEPFRQADPPRLTGAEALAIHIVAQILPAETFVPLADRLLAELDAREPRPPARARLLLVGAELDEPRYVRTIESEGAWVVADRLCFGARSVLGPIDAASADPLDSIARAYFFRPSCARMIGHFSERWEATLAQMRQVRADGIVLERLMFCDPWGADLHNMSERAKAQGIPLLALQREYGIVPTGQLRTRVQAFVERLEIASRRGRRP